MGLRYATVTGVALSDGGAWLYALTMRAINGLYPSTGVQQLILYYSGGPSRLPDVVASRPEVLARYVETAGSQGNCRPAQYSETLPARTLD
jgi:lipoyl synthase